MLPELINEQIESSSIGSTSNNHTTTPPRPITPPRLTHQRTGRRIPSGARPQPLNLQSSSSSNVSPDSSRVTSACSISLYHQPSLDHLRGPQSNPLALHSSSASTSTSHIAPSHAQRQAAGQVGKGKAPQHQPSHTSTSSFAVNGERLVDSPTAMDSVIDLMNDYTTSPEGSPSLRSDRSTPPALTSKRISNSRYDMPSPPEGYKRGKQTAFTFDSPSTATPMSRSNTAPLPWPETPETPSTFTISRPSTPMDSPNRGAPKHKALRLNTSNLATPLNQSSSSPTKAISPGLKHWQQVRQHVLAPSPVDARHTSRPGAPKKLGIVSKAAGRFGFRQAAENVMGYDQRRTSTFGRGLSDLGGLSAEEREEVARERRRFARAIKTCLDACALEEGKRRLKRTAPSHVPSSYKPKSIHHSASEHKTAPSIYSSHHTTQAINFDPEFSAFAPLLTELHRHLPAARAKKLWSRTCPHHSAILAELGVAFLPDSASTDGERQQALEVFGAVVKNWAPDSADTIDNYDFLHHDPTLPSGPDPPHSVFAFQSLAISLFNLSRSLEDSTYDSSQHQAIVVSLIADLSEGNIISIEESVLSEVLGSLEMSGSHVRFEKELLWISVGEGMLVEPALASWFLKNNWSKLKQYQPPLILHAAPPIILRIRAYACAQFLASLASVVNHRKHNISLVKQTWNVARELILPELRHLSSEYDTSLRQLCTLLFSLELCLHEGGDKDERKSSDPFKISMQPASAGLSTDHRDDMICLLQSGGDTSRKAMEEVASQFVLSADGVAVVNMIKFFLDTKDFASLGRACVPAFFDRLSISLPAPKDIIKSFLTLLSTRHPQLFYKPLFSLSASTQSSSLTKHLRTVSSLAQIVGPDKFWTQADPQMVVIILVGDIAPKQNKGKGKEGDPPRTKETHVKLGRYAVLLEFIRALTKVSESGSAGSKLRAFVDAVEARLSVVLDTEEKEASLPPTYRSLICQLYLRLRLITSSLRRSSWNRLVLSWFLAESESPTDDAQIVTLRTVFKAIDKSSEDPNRRLGSTHELDRSLYETAGCLLVAIQACLNDDDWVALLPVVWRRLKFTVDKTMSISSIFLLMKCGEIIPNRFKTLLLSELTNGDPSVRAVTLRQLAHLFGWRFQVLSQPTITDRRGPVFQFSLPNLQFVATEIGSATWVATRDVQDAALKKFGQTLPLELRQRLMELGWSEDSTIAGDENDWEKIPITALHPLSGDMSLSGERASSPSPMRSFMRRSSSGSGHSFSTKRRKPIFPPVLVSVVCEQATLLRSNSDGSVTNLSRELIKLVQREDAPLSIRPFAESITGNTGLALSQLNAMLISITPGFGYSALNSLVGYLRTRLRTEHSPEHWAAALSTIAQLVPHISEISLRDIRKNKAEHVLLAASIHEDEGGFKLHQPWRDNLLDVQTAQLVFLAAVLRANPRDVYLVKKMLFNLQIQASIRHLPFARAWLELIVTLFSAVNRNYTDRAELRHFLHNVAAILTLHGQRDLVVTSRAMHIFILCSARFRRLFSSMGFSTAMRSIYETYENGNKATRDCIEYSARSFYRIHKDSFVYQTCIVIADGSFDAAAVYEFLASLSTGNTATSGVASGIRGLNDKEEIAALVATISGPEIVQLGQTNADRQAHRIASITLEEHIFPRENIVRLFITAIAADPSSSRAIKFLKLLTALVPHFTDEISRQLLREGVEALGGVIVKSKTAENASTLALHVENDGKSDWIAAKREYVFLVESFARSGGELGASTTRRTLDLVVELLRRQPESVGPAASSILGELARTRLSSNKPVSFLREIAPMFRQFISVVDFSRLLDSITELVIRSGYNLDPETTAFVIHDYVEPAIRLLASASEDSMAFIVPLRASAVRLLSAALFLRGDALDVLEHVNRSASLLASVILPLSLLVDRPRDVDRDAVYSSLWIRLLHYVLRPITPRRVPNRARQRIPPQVAAATAVLSLQVVKIIAIRAPESISNVQGLWTHIAAHLSTVVSGGDARFAETGVAPASPRVVDWMMWTTYELVALHRGPLAIPLRYAMQVSLALAWREDKSSRPSSRSAGGGGGFSDRSRNASAAPTLTGLARKVSMRTQSFAVSPGGPEGGGGGLVTGGHGRSPSFGGTAAARGSPESQSYTRQPSASQQLSPLLSAGSSPDLPGGGHRRMTSFNSIGGGSSGGLGVFGFGGAGGSGVNGNAGFLRPSFSDLSARRASRPVFDAFLGGVGHKYRFPSSSGPVRSLGGEKGEKGAAIVHLLGPSLPGGGGGGGGGISPGSGHGGMFSFDSPVNLLHRRTSDGPGAGGGTGIAAGSLGAIDPITATAVREVRLHNEELVSECRRALRTCLMVFGYEVEHENDELPVRVWTAHDALHVISAQTKLMVETEFQQVFNPVRNEKTDDLDDGHGRDNHVERKSSSSRPNINNNNNNNSHLGLGGVVARGGSIFAPSSTTTPEKEKIVIQEYSPRNLGHTIQYRPVFSEESEFNNDESKSNLNENVNGNGNRPLTTNTAQGDFRFSPSPSIVISGEEGYELDKSYDLSYVDPTGENGYDSGRYRDDHDKFEEEFEESLNRNRDGEFGVPMLSISSP